MKKPTIQYIIRPEINDEDTMVIYAELEPKGGKMVYQRSCSYKPFGTDKDEAEYIKQALDCLIRSFWRDERLKDYDWERKNVTMNMAAHEGFKERCPKIFSSLVKALGSAEFIVKIGGKKLELIL